MTKATAELRAQSIDELKQSIVQYKQELYELRVGFVPKTHESRVGKLRLAKKNVARAMNILAEKQKDEALAYWAGKKRYPKQLLPRLTRALRRALPLDLAKRTTRKLPRIGRKNFVVVV